MTWPEGMEAIRMSERAIAFVKGWIEENIHPEAYVAEGDDPRPKEKALQCLVDAKNAGIPKAEIEEEFGDLEDHMAGAMDASTDAEVNRLAAQDD